MIILTDIKIEDLSDVAEVEKSIFRQFTDNLKLNSLDFLMRVLIAVVVLLVGIRVIRLINLKRIKSIPYNIHREIE